MRKILSLLILLPLAGGYFMLHQEQPSGNPTADPQPAHSPTPGQPPLRNDSPGSSQAAALKTHPSREKPSPAIEHPETNPLGARLMEKEEREHLAKKRAEEWIERTHKAAAGANWREIEAQSLAEMIERGKRGGSRAQNGSWVERGPSNVPGRITDADIDYQNGNLYAISDHGIVFKSSDLAATAWSPQNDRFPLGLDVATQLEVFQAGHLVTSGFIKAINQWGVFYSADQGLTWTPSGGLGNLPVMGYRRLLKQGNDVYVLAQEHSGQTDYYKVYKSVDQGVTFQQLYTSPVPAGDGGRHIKSDMWVSNDPINPYFYLTLEDSLFIVNKNTGARTFNSLITGGGGGYHLLTGHEKNGVVQLRAYTAQPTSGKFYAWSSQGNTWTYQGEMTESWLAYPFGSNSFTCSQENADTLYFGAILTSQSTDGGQTWTVMDLDPTGSYAQYHGDVPKCLTTINPVTNQEEVYLGTDGGLYKLDAPTQHFESVSIPGLNCTQIYKMVSRQDSTGHMFIGTQDNGYSHTANGAIQQGAADFTFQWGGDVSSMASGDGGASFWLWWLGDGCNYQTGPADAGTVSNWSPYAVNGQIPYWEAPIWVSNHFPDRCYTAGFINGANGSHLLKLTAQPGAPCDAAQFPTDFSTIIDGNISAIAISPIDSNYLYVATSSGHFFQSTDGGNSWSNVLIANTMYPKAILPSSLSLGEVWVIGSGYSNSPVYHSTDNGQNFTALDAGLPSCMAEAIATNEDESVLYLATSIGPFSFSQADQAWADVSNSEAPLVHYMDVEFLPATQTVRFATYARGVWDFNISDPSGTPEAHQAQSLRVYPNPCTQWLNIVAEPSDITHPFEIHDIEGKLCFKGVIDSERQSVQVSTLPPGVFFLTLPDANKSTRFIKE